MTALCHLEKYHKNTNPNRDYFGFSKNAKKPSLYQNKQSPYINTKKGKIMMFDFPRNYLQNNVKPQVDKFCEKYRGVKIDIIRKKGGDWIYKYKAEILDVDKRKKKLKLKITKVITF